MTELWFIMTLVFISIALVSSVLIYSGHAGLLALGHRFVESADRRLSRLFLFANSRYLLVAYGACLLIAPIALMALSMALPYIVIATLLIIVSPKIVLSQLEKRRRQQIDEDLPDVLAQMAGGMRAGATLNAAMIAMVEENDGPLGQEFSLTLREQRLGMRFEEAMENLGERVQSESMDLVVSASLIARDVGGNLSEIYQRLSDTLRRKHEMERRIKALTAQGVLQGWVVSLLPFGIMGALVFIEPDAISMLWGSLLGWVVLAVVFILVVLGGLMVRKIVTIDV